MPPGARSRRTGIGESVAVAEASGVLWPDGAVLLFFQYGQLCLIVLGLRLRAGGGVRVLIFGQALLDGIVEMRSAVGIGQASLLIRGVFGEVPGVVRVFGGGS